MIISFNDLTGAPTEEKHETGFYFDFATNKMYFKIDEESILTCKGEAWRPYWVVTIQPVDNGYSSTYKLPEGFLTPQELRVQKEESLTFDDLKKDFPAPPYGWQMGGYSSDTSGSLIQSDSTLRVYYSLLRYYIYYRYMIPGDQYGSGISTYSYYVLDNDPLIGVALENYYSSYLYHSASISCGDTSVDVRYPMSHWETDDGTHYNHKDPIPAEWKTSDTTTNLTLHYAETAEPVDLPSCLEKTGFRCLGWYNGDTLVASCDSLTNIQFGSEALKGLSLEPRYEMIPLEYVQSHTLSDATWENICIVSDAYKTMSDEDKQVVRETWKLGDTAPMLHGESYWEEFEVRLIAYEHDYLADNSGKPTFTFAMHKSYFSDDASINDEETNTTGWEYSGIRSSMSSRYEQLTWLAEGSYDNTFLKPISTPIQIGGRSIDLIKPVLKYTARSGEDGTIFETVDKLFLFSATELYGDTPELAYENEGHLYAADDGSPVLGSIGDSGYTLWLRSPAKDTTTDFCTVEDTCGTNDYGYYNGLSKETAGNSNALLIGFCV